MFLGIMCICLHKIITEMKGITVLEITVSHWPFFKANIGFDQPFISLFGHIWPTQILLVFCKQSRV